MKNSLYTTFLTRKLESAKKHKFFVLFYCFILFPILFMAMLSKYGDCIAYTQWSVNIWDALFSGRIREYFLVSAEKLRGYGVGNPFGILYLLPWAIWNFPLWLSRVITHSDTVATTLCLTWSKLFLVLCLHIIALYCTKITGFFTGDTKDRGFQLLYILGCGTMFVSAAFFGQDEVIYMAALVAGIYYTLIGRKILGYILLGTSVTLCNIMLVPVLAILLTKEKNLLKILALLVCFVLPEKLASTFCGIGLLQLPEIANAYKVAPPFPPEALFDWFFVRTTFQFSDLRFSFFAVSLIVLFVCCYLKRHESAEQENFSVILCPALSLLAMTTFSWLHAYRWFVYFPLLASCVFIKWNKKEGQRIVLLILWLLDVCKLLMMLPLDYCLRQSSLGIGFLSRFWKHNGYQADFYSLLHFALDEEKWIPVYYIVVSSLAVSCAVMLLVFILKKSQSVAVDMPKKATYALFPSMPAVVLCVMLLLPALVNIQYRIIHPNSPLSAPINCENSIEQEYNSSSLTKLRFIKIRPCTWDKQYSENLMLSISLIDKETGDTVMKKEVPANSLPNNHIMKVPFAADLRKNHQYTFKFVTGGGYI